MSLPMVEILNPFYDFPVDTNDEIIVGLIKDFFRDGITDILSFYKAWIVIWGIGDTEDDERVIPPIVNIGFVREYYRDLDPVIHEIFTVVIIKDYSHPVVFGTTVAVFKDGKLQKRDGFRCDSRYFCDRCGEHIQIGGYMCEMCDFDLCDKCSTLEQHDHPMFQYIGYYGANAFAQSNILIRLQYDITTGSWL
jgi:hypothetical protein